MFKTRKTYKREAEEAGQLALDYLEYAVKQMDIVKAKQLIIVNQNTIICALKEDNNRLVGEKYELIRAAATKNDKDGDTSNRWSDYRTRSVV